MILVRIHILFYPEFEKLVEYLRSGHLTKGDKSGKLVFITHTSVLWRWIPEQNLKQIQKDSAAERKWKETIICVIFFYSKTEEYRKIEKQHQNNTQKEENRGF